MTNWSIVLLILSLAALQSAKAEVQVGSAVVTTIDAEDLLAKSLNINRAPRPAEDDACPGGGGGPGFRAKRYCRYVRTFRDLKVERLLSVTVGQVDTSKIPAYRKDERLYFENSWKSDPYPFDQEVTYSTEQFASVNFNESLTKVQDFSSSISIDAKIFDSVGVRTDDKIGRSVTFNLSQASTRSLSEKFSIQQRIKFAIPPCTARWADYSDIKKDISIPIKLTGVLTGRVVDFVQGYGDIPVSAIDSTVPIEKRTFEITGTIELLGSNRSLSVKLGEKKITDGECR